MHIHTTLYVFPHFAIIHVLVFTLLRVYICTCTLDLCNNTYKYMYVHKCRYVETKLKRLAFHILISFAILFLPIFVESIHTKYVYIYIPISVEVSTSHFSDSPPS